MIVPGKINLPADRILAYSGLYTFLYDLLFQINGRFQFPGIKAAWFVFKYLQFIGTFSFRKNFPSGFLIKDSRQLSGFVPCDLIIRCLDGSNVHTLFVRSVLSGLRMEGCKSKWRNLFYPDADSLFFPYCFDFFSMRIQNFSAPIHL